MTVKIYFHQLRRLVLFTTHSFCSYDLCRFFFFRGGGPEIWSFIMLILSSIACNLTTSTLFLPYCFSDCCVFEWLLFSLVLFKACMDKQRRSESSHSILHDLISSFNSRRTHEKRIAFLLLHDASPFFDVGVYADDFNSSSNAFFLSQGLDYTSDCKN